MFVRPSLNADAFNCPHCKAYGPQVWANVPNGTLPDFGAEFKGELRVSTCQRCKGQTIWHRNKMVYPKRGVSLDTIDWDKVGKVVGIVATVAIAIITRRPPKGAA